MTSLGTSAVPVFSISLGRAVPSPAGVHPPAFLLRSVGLVRALDLSGMRRFAAFGLLTCRQVREPPTAWPRS